MSVSVIALCRSSILLNTLRVAIPIRSSWSRQFPISCSRASTAAATATSTSALATPTTPTSPAASRTAKSEELSSTQQTEVSKRASQPARIIWNPSMDRTLLEGKQEGRPLLQIAAELGLGIDTVVLKRRTCYLRSRAGEPPVRERRRWTQSEEDHFIRRYQEGASTAEIANELGRSIESVKTKRVQILYGPDPIIAPRKPRKWQRDLWTNEDCEALLQMRSEGVRWDFIATKLARSPDSCRVRGHILKAASTAPLRWSADEDARLKDLHSEFGSRWTRITPHFPRRTFRGVKYRAAALGLIGGASSGPADGALAEP
jgi:hypothetical protein